MKLTKLHLTNYRAAENLEIDLHRRLNVFIGANGAGKTTVLESIAIMLSWVVKRIENPKGSGQQIIPFHITNGKTFSRIELYSEVNNELLTWKLYKVRQGKLNLSKENSILTTLKIYTEKVREQLTYQNATNLTLFVYYPVNRAVLDIPLKIRKKHLFEPLAAYENSLTSGADFRIFFEWFRQREDIENENFKLIQKNQQNPLLQNNNIEDNITYPDRQLETVRKAIENFLPGFTNPTVRRSPLRLEITKHTETLRIDQLSDGEKCLVAMVGDLARRMVMLHQNHSEPLNASGIILIDEIDLHLHPQWQRLIIPTLLKTFPNCQFIITTHSPHVVTHVQPENLQIIHQTEKGLKVNLATESYGKTAERILEDLMGLATTRPSEIEQFLQEIYLDIDQHQLDNAKNKLNSLRETIKSTADSELTRLELMIRREERKNR
ncbi:MAG: AAA family ATPase [Symploca sp. SIO2G7]|nr:AAA family ATPase [Symploca sp. SIO2G7]